MIFRKLPDLDHPELSVFRQIREPAVLRRAEICLSEGVQTVRRLLTSAHTVVSLVLTPECMEQVSPLLQSTRFADVPVWCAEKSRIEKFVGMNLNQGVLAASRRPEMPGVLTSYRSSPSFLLVVLDGVSHAVNVGTIIRNCVAFHCDGLIVGKKSGDPYSPRAVKASAGAIFHLPVFADQELDSVLTRMKQELQMRMIVAESQGASVPEIVDFSGKVSLILGNEHQGVSEHIRKMADGSVSIPLNNVLDSLSVASASAVLLYAAQRQRPKKPLKNS